MSPGFRRASFAVEAPTCMKIEVTVPALGVPVGDRERDPLALLVRPHDDEVARLHRGRHLGRLDRQQVEVGDDHPAFDDSVHAPPCGRTASPRPSSVRGAPRSAGRAAPSPDGARRGSEPRERLEGGRAASPPRPPHACTCDRVHGAARARPGRPAPASDTRRARRPTRSRARPARCRDLAMSSGFIRSPSSRWSSPSPSTTAARSMPRWRKTDGLGDEHEAAGAARGRRCRCAGRRGAAPASAPAAAAPGRRSAGKPGTVGADRGAHRGGVARSRARRGRAASREVGEDPPVGPGEARARRRRAASSIRRRSSCTRPSMLVSVPLGLGEATPPAGRRRPRTAAGRGPGR